MNRQPITRQRSQWTITRQEQFAIGHRHVNDGTLRAIVGNEPAGWHMSISHVDHRGRPRRYPTWDEIAHARDALLPADVGFVMHLPVADEYVAIHPTTFHLHEHPERQGDT